MRGLGKKKMIEARLDRQTKCTKIIKNNTKYCCINTYKGYLHLL